MIPRGTPTPAPIAAAWELELEDGAGVEEADVVSALADVVEALDGEVLVDDVEEDEVEVEVLLCDRGICATNDATGWMAKILLGVSQQAKEPTPEVPLSQQSQSDQCDTITHWNGKLTFSCRCNSSAAKSDACC